MKASHRKFLIAALSTVCVAAVTPAVQAQPRYPDQPIRLVVPFPPGGTADVIGRLFAQQLGQELKVSIIVDNKGGAGGSIGTRAVADARPDGYTLLLASSSTHGTNPAVYQKLPYSPVEGFTPITQIVTVPGTLSVNKNVKVANLQELIALSKAQPDALSYASSGAGGLGNLAMELLKSQSGARILHVAYKGAGPAFTDVIGGQVAMIWEPLPSSLPYIKSGQLRPLAVASRTRSPELPDVPTFEEAGIRPYDAVAWNGLLAPRGLPADITKKLHAASVKALQDPKLQARLKELGGTVVANTPAQFEQVIRTDVAKWKHVATEARISLD